VEKVDQYLKLFSNEVRIIFENIRTIVNDCAPQAIEDFVYGMVGYKLDGKPLVYFGGFFKHIGFYATPQGQEAFKDRLKSYKQGRGSVRFPLNKPIQFELIREMVKARVQETQLGR